MTPEFLASHHISFDYKSTGSYFLQMLQSEFSYDCLMADDFDDLIDELANEMPDQCFTPVASHIAGHGLGLWQIDFYEDTFHLAVVPQAHTEAFQAYWSTGFLDNPEEFRTFKPKLRLIAAPAAKKAAPAPSGKRKLVVDSMRFGGDPGIDIDRAVALVWDPYSDDKTNGKFVDFSVWPPRDAPLPTRAEDDDFAFRWSQVYQDGAHNIWMCEDPRVEGQRSEAATFKLARIDDMAAWSPVWLGGGASMADTYAALKWMNGSLMHVSGGVDDAGKPGKQVMRMSDGACESWYRSRKRLNLFPFPDGQRCLIVENETRLAIAAGPVTNDDFWVLSKPLYNSEEGVIALEDEVVVYFTGTKRFLMMHRLDARTMRHEMCLLDGFGHTQVVDGVRHAGFGNLKVCKGHGDWWIFNHLSNQFGTVDIAMFWNAKTDETFKIVPKDLPRQQPTIIYQRALGRYLALQYDTVSLLVEFEELYDSKEKLVLEWRTA